MTNHWRVEKLSDACEFHNGLWKGEKGPLVNVGVIRNTNFTKEGALDDSDIAYLDVEEKKFAKRRLRFGDIILEKSGGGPKQAVGRVAFFDKKVGDYSFSNFTSAIRVRDQKSLLPEYLHRFLYWQYLSGVTESMQSHSTGIRNLDGDAYKAIEVAFPGIREQQRIVALLDEAFVGIATAKANAEKNLRLARDTLQAKITEVMNRNGGRWEEKRVSEIAVHSLGKMLDKAKNRGEFRPYLRNLNVRWFEFDLSDVLRMRFEPTETERYSVEKGDLVICEGGYPGRAAVWTSDEPMFFQKALHRARFHNPMHANWLLYYLHYRDNEGTLSRHFNGAGIQHFTGAALAKFELPIPPDEELPTLLQVFDALRNEVANLETIYTRKLTALNELKQSLLHRAFSGQL